MRNQLEKMMEIQMQSRALIPKPSTLNHDPKTGFPKISGYLFGGPHNRDSGILGSTFGSPYLRKVPEP